MTSEEDLWTKLEEDGKHVKLNEIIHHETAGSKGGASLFVNIF